MSNIFLDVGGHYGETLTEVFKPAYRFDVVHCFEPQQKCHQQIAETFATVIQRGFLHLHNAGLADFTGERELFGGATSSIGASLFADKKDVNERVSEKCSFLCATEFIKRHVGKDDFAVMKLNCEGGEVLILRDLIRSGAIHLLNSVYIDFDTRKIPSQQQEENKILAELQLCGFTDYVTAQELARVHTYSFSKKKLVERVFTSNQIYLFLVLLKEAARVKRLTLADRILRILPLTWVKRAMRIKYLINKRTLRHRHD